MPGSIKSAFSEPEDFEAALRAEGCRNLLITGCGQFRAHMTQIVLHRVRLSAGDEHLARIAFIAVPADMVLISFPIGNGALPVYGGIEMRVGEIMTLSPGEHLHARTTYSTVFSGRSTYLLTALLALLCAYPFVLDATWQHRMLLGFLNVAILVAAARGDQNASHIFACNRVFGAAVPRAAGGVYLYQQRDYRRSVFPDLCAVLPVHDRPRASLRPRCRRGYDRQNTRSDRRLYFDRPPVGLTLCVS
jgi:hypothetical protein